MACWSYPRLQHLLETGDRLFRMRLQGLELLPEGLQAHERRDFSGSLQKGAAFQRRAPSGSLEPGLKISNTGAFQLRGGLSFVGAKRLCALASPFPPLLASVIPRMKIPCSLIYKDRLLVSADLDSFANLDGGAVKDSLSSGGISRFLDSFSRFELVNPAKMVLI